MAKEEIIRIINVFLSEEFEIEESALTENARMREDLKIDSLDFVDIAVEVEKQFQLKITPDEMKGVKTLGEFYSFIEDRQK